MGWKTLDPGDMVTEGDKLRLTLCSDVPLTEQDVQDLLNLNASLTPYEDAYTVRSVRPTVHPDCSKANTYNAVVTVDTLSEPQPVSDYSDSDSIVRVQRSTNTLAIIGIAGIIAWYLTRDENKFV